MSRAREIIVTAPDGAETRYKSCRKCAEAFGLFATNITFFARRGWTYKGNKFRYANHEVFVVTDIDGTEREYEHLADAAKDLYAGSSYLSLRAKDKKLLYGRYKVEWREK